MELNSYLEKNLIEYLDKRNTEINKKAENLRAEEFDLYEITKDYSRDLSEALSNQDLVKAKKILEDIKSKYLEAPANSLSKKRLYTIMEEVYEQIKDYETKEQGKEGLFDTIKSYEEKGLFTKPELFAKEQAHSLQIILSSIARKEKQLEEELEKDLEIVDLKKSINLYKEIKQLVDKIPGDFKNEKEKATKSAIQLHKKVDLIKESVIRKKSNEKKDKEDQEGIDSQLEKVRSYKKKFIEIHGKVDNLLAQHDFKNSIEEYHKLKEILDNWPNEMLGEKEALMVEASELFHKIKTQKDTFIETDKEKRKERERILREKKKEEERIEKEKSLKKSFSEMQTEEQEIEDLIQKKHYSEAMKEYHSLVKKHMNEFKEDNPKIKQLGKKMKELYEEIDESKELEEHKDLFRKIRSIQEATLSHLDKKEISKAIFNYKYLKNLCNEIPTVLEDKKAEIVAEALALHKKIVYLKEEAIKRKQQKVAEEIHEKEEHKNQIKKRIKEHLKTIKEFIDYKDPINAMKEYHEVHKLFTNYPEDNIDEKKQLLDEMRAYHKDIELLEQDVKKKQPVPFTSTKKVSEAEKLIKEAHNDLDKGLNNKTAHKILEAKHKIQMLPKEEFDKKYKLLKEIEALEHKHLFVKNVNKINSKNMLTY